MDSIPEPPPPPSPPCRYFLPPDLLEDDEFSEKRRQKELQFHLVSAIEHEDTEKVKSLIHNGVNTNATIILVKTPLTHALDQNSTSNLDIVRMLVDAEVTDVNYGDLTPWGWKPLHYAANNGSVPQAQVLIEGSKKGQCNIDVRDNGKATALHLAAWFGHVELSEYLLKMGADANLKDNCGRTPLHRACESGNLTIAEILLKYGMDINVADNYGWSPIFQNVFFLQNDTVKFLLKNGANPNLRDKFGQSLLHLASYNKVSPIHKEGHPERVVLMTAFNFYERSRRIPSSLLQSLIYFMDHRINDTDMFTCVKMLLNAGIDPRLYPSDGFSTDSCSVVAQIRAYLTLAGAGLSPHDSWVQPRSTQGSKWREWFKYEINDQLGLRRLCRYKIRSCLNHTGDLRGAIKLLPIPGMLKKLLTLDQDFEMFSEFVRRNQ